MKFVKKFKNMKLANKFLIVFIIFIGIYGSLVYIALAISFNIYDEKLYDKSIQELDFFSQNINRELKSSENLSYETILDENVQEQLYKLKNLDKYSNEYNYELNLFQRYIINELNLNQMIKDITYVYDKKIVFNLGIPTMIVDNKNFNQWLDEFSNARGGYVTKNPTNDFPYLVAGRDVLKYTDNSLDYLGTLVYTYDISGVFEKQINELETGSAELYVYSPDGVIFKSPGIDNMDLGKIDLEDKYKIITINGEKYFMCYLISSVNDWTYVNIFPYSKIYGQISIIKTIMTVGPILMFLILLIVMKKISRVVTAPLEQLTESMHILETGDFKNAKKVLEQNNQNDEVGQLTHEFSIAIESIENLIHENYEKQLMIKDVEYRMLQAQMNPHFLYNTLNTINWLIKGNKNDDAIKMIMQLSEVLRASFSKKHYVSVEDDLDLAKNYIGIQEYRYKSRVEIQINSSGNLSEFLIPLMTIQPLIENSIQHGIESSLEPCKIIVNVAEEENRILIEVIDTGTGMTTENLEKVRNFTAIPKGNGIGLKNISERLKLKYENSELEINSILGKGTAVRISIPKITGVKNV